MVAQSKSPKLNRRSTAHFKAFDRSESQVWTSLYGNTFIEDVRTHVMPIGGRSRSRPDFCIELVPPDKVVDEILRRAFAERLDYSIQGLTEAISGFIENHTPMLCLRGRIHFEIANLVFEEEKRMTTKHQEPTGSARLQFRPVLIPGRVIDLAVVHMQLIPVQKWDRAGRPFNIIPSRSVWTISIPGELGTPRKQRRMMRNLIRLSAPTPPFVEEGLRRLENIQDFSHGEFHEAQVRALARTTALWGWTARTLWQESALEYYLAYRHLRFAHAMAILREHMIASINTLLRRLSISSQLLVKGLPTASQISKLLKRMEAGEMSFTDVYEAVDIL